MTQEQEELMQNEQIDLLVQYVQRADLPEEVRPEELQKVERVLLGEKRQREEESLGDGEPLSL